MKRRQHKALATAFLQKLQGTFAHFSTLTQKAKSRGNTDSNNSEKVTLPLKNVWYHILTTNNHDNV